MPKSTPSRDQVAQQLADYFNEGAKGVVQVAVRGTGGSQPPQLVLIGILPRRAEELGPFGPTIRLTQLVQDHGLSQGRVNQILGPFKDDFTHVLVDIRY